MSNLTTNHTPANQFNSFTMTFTMQNANWLLLNECFWALDRVKKATKYKQRILVWAWKLRKELKKLMHPQDWLELLKTLASQALSEDICTSPTSLSKPKRASGSRLTPTFRSSGMAITIWRHLFCCRRSCDLPGSLLANQWLSAPPEWVWCRPALTDALHPALCHFSAMLNILNLLSQ